MKLTPFASYFYEKRILKPFRLLNSFNRWVQLVKKPACYRPFKTWHFLRVCTEETIDYKYRENQEGKWREKHFQTIIRWKLIIVNAIQVNQKIICNRQFHRAIGRNLEDSWKILASLVSEFYHRILAWRCQSALKRVFPLLYVFMQKTIPKMSTE